MVPGKCHSLSVTDRGQPHLGQQQPQCTVSSGDLKIQLLGPSLPLGTRLVAGLQLVGILSGSPCGQETLAGLLGNLSPLLWFLPELSPRQQGSARPQPKATPRLLRCLSAPDLETEEPLSPRVSDREWPKQSLLATGLSSPNSSFQHWPNRKRLLRRRKRRRNKVLWSGTSWSPGGLQSPPQGRL